jgi:hypothetical protein
MRAFRIAFHLLAAGLLSACGGGQRATQMSAQDIFWYSIQELCGQAFPGTIIYNSPPDPAFTEKRLVMHVRECMPDEIRIPFHVGEDRSRTWILMRTEGGLRLLHDHRHEDGSEEDINGYGGHTTGPGDAEWQEFPADEYTASLIPAAAANIWTIEIVPGEHFAYMLRRPGTDRRFRVEFDLTTPVEPPPAPWGY